METTFIGVSSGPMDRPSDRRLLGPSLAALALALVTGLACGDDATCGGLDGEVSPRCSVFQTDSNSATATNATSSGDTDTGTGTDTDAGTDTEDSSTSGLPNLCETNAIGEWNACKKGPLIDNSKCNWEDDGVSAGEITCISPSSGGGNVCSIEQCEDACDCFAQPLTGTAPVVCAPVLNDNVKGCVLDCGSDQICPDGMECFSGYCYWPNETL